MINLKQPEIKNGEGFKVTLIGWDATREILGPLYDGRAHWIIVAHILAMPLIETIERKYYLGDRNDDFTLITSAWRGSMFILVAAKKRHMQPYQLSSLLRQMVGISISEAETARRDLTITAPDALMEDATELAVMLFDRRELAIAA